MRRLGCRVVCPHSPVACQVGLRCLALTPTLTLQQQRGGGRSYNDNRSHNRGGDYPLQQTYRGGGGNGRGSAPPMQWGQGRGRGGQQGVDRRRDRSEGGDVGGYAGRRRNPHQDNEAIIETLVDLKRQYKQAKSAKARREITREARRAVRRFRVDPSSQDERAMTILLNTAATFHVHSADSVDDAVQWMRNNLKGLTPQNVALFANAIGLLQVSQGDTILAEEVSPMVQAVMTEMTPVEMVMVLQAFQRMRVGHENPELQDALIRQLSPQVEGMTTSVLSTFASVVARHPFKERDPAAWQSLAEKITEYGVRPAENMHSKEVIVFLTCAAHLGMPQERIVQLLRRATATVGFHTTEQIGELYRAIANIKRHVAEPSEDLGQACTELERALVGRLDRVAEFASLRDVAALWRYTKACGVTLPAAVQSRLIDAVMVDMAWERQSFPALAQLAQAASGQALPSTDVLSAVGDYVIGKRPPRRGSDGELRTFTDERTEEQISEARARIYARFFDPLVRTRLSLEEAIAAQAGSLPKSVGSTLPAELERNVGEATPRQVLLAVEHIALAPADCALRNTANDAALLAAVEARVKADAPLFRERVSPGFRKRWVEALETAPKAKGVVDAVKALDAEA